MNNFAKSWTASLKASFFSQALLGSKISLGTPFIDFGMSRLKILQYKIMDNEPNANEITYTGDLENSPWASSPEWIASIMAREYFKGHRLPIPYLPPTHPVLTSYVNVLTCCTNRANLQNLPKLCKNDVLISQPTSWSILLDAKPNHSVIEQFWSDATATTRKGSPKPKTQLANN